MQQHQPLLFCLVNRLWRLLEYKRSHYYRALNLTHTHRLANFLCHWSHWMKQIQTKPTQYDQSAIMGGRLTKKATLKRSTGYKIVSIHFLSVGMAGVWKKNKKKNTQKLARLLRSVKPRSTVYTKMMVCAVCPSSLSSHVCACFLTSTETKEISRGIWNDYGSASYCTTLLDSRTSFSQVFLPLPSVHSSLSLIMLRTAESLLSASA